jgi:hypothetical protein
MRSPAEHSWERCNADLSSCTAIAGETGSGYTQGPDDVGKRVRSRVKASNDVGNASAPSGATALVTALAPHNTALPPVIGTARDSPASATSACAPTPAGRPWPPPRCR